MHGSYSAWQSYAYRALKYAKKYNFEKRHQYLFVLKASTQLCSEENLSKILILVTTSQNSTLLQILEYCLSVKANNADHVECCETLLKYQHHNLKSSYRSLCCNSHYFFKNYYWKKLWHLQTSGQVSLHPHDVICHMRSPFKYSTKNEDFFPSLHFCFSIFSEISPKNENIVMGKNLHFGLNSI